MRRRSNVALVVAFSAVVWLVGCSGPNAQSEPTPAQELKASLASFVSARSISMDGTLALEHLTYHVTLNEDDTPRTDGTITLNEQQVTFQWTGQQLFMMGADYFSAQHLSLGSRWVLTHSDKLQPLITRLSNRKELVDSLTAMAGSNVTRRSGDSIRGVRTVQFVSDQMNVTAPAVGGPPLRLATAVDAPLSDGLSDLKLSIAVFSAPTAFLTSPNTYVDLADLNTLPANFEEVTRPTDSFRFENCDEGGCTLSDDFRNVGGRLGESTATFHVMTGGKPAGSCTVTIPATDHDGTVRVGCRVDWDTTASDAGAGVEISNPI